MIGTLRNTPAFVVSLIVHILIIVVLLFIPTALKNVVPEVTLETIFSEDRDAVEYDQQLTEDMEVSENLSFVAGGTVSTAVGASAEPVAAQVKVTESTAIKEPALNPSLNDISIPTESGMIGNLGAGMVTGETGAVVDGYGAAMHRLTLEILRMMREKKTLVVWLFDESESMVDDQKEIRDNFAKIYEELGIAQAKQQAEAKGRRRGRAPEVLQTVIASYGAGVNNRTNTDPNNARPTADLKNIKAAIDRIQVDPTGAENMCSAIIQVCRKYGQMSKTRQLAIVIVTDESGDDGAQIDQAIVAAKSVKAPVYVLGRESVFGYPHTHQDWTHKETGLTFPLRIRRGPETAFPECLQWDGIHARWDAYGAGFGPYEQVRLARDTGGIFFQLPGEEENLRREGANDSRQYDALAMKVYQPLLLPRRTYLQERSGRPFRNTLFQVIARLNPTENKLLFARHDEELNMRRWHYPIDLAQFRTEAGTQVQRAARAMGLVNEAIGMLERIQPERSLEESQRWRAAYDLSYAQLVTFRLRLYQYLLTMDNHVNTNRMPKNKKSNEWNMHSQRKSIVPDEAQYSRIRTTFNLKQSREEYLAMVKEEERRATALLKKVVKLHPGTPWAQRAQTELGRGFGHRFVEGYRDPRYQTMANQIKKPNL